jgi:hypothetical protein
MTYRRVILNGKLEGMEVVMVYIKLSLQFSEGMEENYEKF